MIEDILNTLHWQLRIAEIQYTQTGAKPNRETAIIYNMYLLGVPHFPQLYDAGELTRLNEFMRDTWYKDQEKLINDKLMKGPGQ